MHDRDAAADGLPHEGQASGPWIARVEWQAWLLLGWGLAVVGQIAAIAHQRSRLERLLRTGELPATTLPCSPWWPSSPAGSGCGGGRGVMIIDDEGSPFVCGLWRPSLVLPRGLTRSLDLESLRSVLLHELAHIRRRDLLWDWIPAIARLLYFFHPAAHFIVCRARLERELACDQTAMVLTGLGAAGYASTLVEIVSRSSAPPALRAALAAAGLDGAAPCPAPVCRNRDHPFLTPALRGVIGHDSSDSDPGPPPWATGCRPISARSGSAGWPSSLRPDGPAHACRGAIG